MAAVVDILWFVEHVARELDVACAVKGILEQKYGLSVQIRHLDFDRETSLQQFSPKVVVFPYFYRESDPGVRDYCCAWPNAKFFNMSWEELFYGANSHLKRPADDFAKNRVLHHAWGEFYKKYLMNYGVPPHSIFVNGNPAFQLYRFPYKEYFKDRLALAKEFGLNYKKRWIFIPENYRWAFVPDESIESLKTRNADISELLKVREYCRTSLSDLIKWAANAASADFEIILRPRPATNDNEFKSFMKASIGETPCGLHIIRDGSVREWILASDVVMSSYSTSLIEAALAEKAIFMVEPRPLLDSLKCSWHSFIPRIHSKEEFTAVCSGAIDQSSYINLRDWATQEMLNHGDPIQGLAQHFAGLVQSMPRPTFTFLSYLRALQYRIAGLKRNAVSLDLSDLILPEDVSYRVEKWHKLLRSTNG